MGHEPVMLQEALAALRPADGEVFVDGTYGGGGYARGVLAAADCRLLGIDRDLDAVARAEVHARAEPRLTPVLGRFADMDALARGLGVEDVDGVVLDLGVSSFQIDEAERGFSFMRDGPLDMRMGRAGPSAADAVNGLEEAALARVIFQLGEEPRSRRIAKSIAERREARAFETTGDLAGVVEAAVGGRKGARIHPATKTFQAIRMFVNDELGEVARGLAAAERLLKAGGRLVVVTFHSLEDRIVKAFFKSRSGKGGGGSRHAPEKLAGAQASFSDAPNRAVAPRLDEVEANPRARSAKLRSGVRTDAPAWTEPVETGVDLPSLSGLEARR